MEERWSGARSEGSGGALVAALSGGLLYGAAFNLVLRPGAGALAPPAALVGLGLIFKSVAGGELPPTAYRLPPTVLRSALCGGAAYFAAATVALYWMSCITPLAYAGIAVCLGLYGLVFGALAALVRRGAGAAAFPWLAAALWAALEFARGRLFTGFPWMLAGSVWAGLPPAMGAADLGGAWLVSFATVLLPALAVAEKPARRHARLITAAVVALVFLGYGFFRSHRPPPTAYRLPPLRVAAVQPRVEFKVGPKADPEEMLQKQRAISAGVEPGTVDLLIWSETMVPGDLLEQVEPLLAPIAREKRCWLLAGGVVHEKDAAGERTGRAWNSALLLDPRGAPAGRYDKRHLVPFGEYVPLSRRFPGAGAVFELIGTTFTPGEPARALPVAAELPLGVFICYEDVFPELARGDVRRGARLLVNLTNDAWFRRTAEARQHLALAAFRAAETRCPLVRATNSGVSALVDADGRVTVPENGGLWKQGLVRMDVPAEARKLPPYVFLGDAFAWLAAAAAGAAALAGLVRRPRPAAPPPTE